MKQRNFIWIGILQATCVNAQDAISHTPPDETMVVEATYWPESGANIPATRHSIPAATFASPALENIERLSQYVANTIVENSSVQPRVIIRGQSSFDTGLSSPVGYMIDGLSLPLGMRQAPDFLGIENVEVIKGAQGSYYGRNSESGVIKISSLTPSKITSGWGEYSYLQSEAGKGNASGHQLEAGIQGGTDSLAALIAIRAVDAESPYYNVFRQSADENDHDRLHVMTGFNYTPSDDTTIELRSRWQDSNNGRATMRFLSGPMKTDRFTVNQNTLSNEGKTTSLHALRVDHEFDETMLTAITGYTDYLQDFTIDADTGPRPIPATTSHLHDITVSQEIRLASRHNSGIQWAAGTYLYQQDTQADFTMGFSGLPRQTDIDQWGIAGFGHLQVPLSNTLTVTAGLRVEHTEQDGSMTGIGPQPLEASLSDVQWLPNLIASYQFAHNQMTYASWSTGYLPGGFNYNSAISKDNFTYEAEYTHSFELGYQSDWFNQNLQTEIALFYNQIRDKQMIDLLPGMVQKVSNASEADIYGIEGLANWHIDDQWGLSVLVGLQNGESKFSSNSPIAQGQSRNDLPNTPDYTWSVGLSYAPVLTVSTELAVRGSDDYYFDSQNTLKQDAYEVVDFSADYQIDALTLAFAVNNLFDEEIFSRAVNTPAGTIVEDTQPRTFSISANYQW